MEYETKFLNLSIGQYLGFGSAGVCRQFTIQLSSHESMKEQEEVELPH